MPMDECRIDKIIVLHIYGFVYCEISIVFRNFKDVSLYKMGILWGISPIDFHGSCRNITVRKNCLKYRLYKLTNLIKFNSGIKQTCPMRTKSIILEIDSVFLNNNPIDFIIHKLTIIAFVSMRVIIQAVTNAFFVGVRTY